MTLTHHNRLDIISPEASIIIVNYNSGEQLQECLDSLYLDLHIVSYEVIVVDNASTDGSQDTVAKQFPEIVFLQSETNTGFGEANNLGAHVAHGKYLAFLNPDTLVHPGWLEELLYALKNEESAGLVTPRILLKDRPEQMNTAGNAVHISGLTLCRGMNAPATAFGQMDAVGAISGAAFAMRRDLFLELGGFDSDFFLYVEDTDLSLRARLAGYRCLYVPEAVVYHDYTLRFGHLKTYYQERNRYRMLVKNYRWRTLLLLAPSLLLAECVTWGFVLLRDRTRWRNKWRAYIDTLRDWRQLLVQRRQVQTQRRSTDRELLQLVTHRLDYDQTGPGAAATLASAVIDPLFAVWLKIVHIVIGW